MLLFIGPTGCGKTGLATSYLIHAVNSHHSGLFFDLIKQRHRKKCTILTSQLGFDEWASFINDKHITAAILDRITENCTVFNMNKCIRIRRKKISYVAEKQPDK